MRVFVRAYAFSTRTAHTLYSGHLAGVVESGDGEPVGVAVLEVEGHPGFPGCVFPETRARVVICPRRELTRTSSPSTMPSFSASTVLISMNDVLPISSRPAVLPVMAQALY